MILSLTCIVLAVHTVGGQDKKWVWASNSSPSNGKVYTGIISNERRFIGEIGGAGRPLFQPNQDFGLSNPTPTSSGNQRYEIDETLENERPNPNNYRPPPIQTNRPGFNRPIDTSFNRPIGGSFNRPDNSFNRPIDNSFNRPIDNSFNRPNGVDFNNNGPTSFPNNGPYRPNGNGYRPPTSGYRPGVGVNGKPILTGPRPLDPNRYHDFDKCKCVHSFNCNSPGIKFGSCDIDKQYCCYSSEQVGPYDVRDVGPGPVRGGAILVGPTKSYNNDRPYQRPGGSRPFGPFSELDRYVSNREEIDLNSAYRKGLESAIYERYERPSRPNFNRFDGNRDYYRPNNYNGYRDYYNNNYSNRPNSYNGYRDYYNYNNRDYDRDYRREREYGGDYYKSDFNRFEGKYGLYVEPYFDYGGRSAKGSILAQNSTSVE